MSTRRWRIVAGLVTLVAAAAISATAAKAQVVTPPMLGVWQGDAAVVVPWVHQRKIPVTLTFLANDSVGGTIGDATLVGGWFTTRDPRSRVGLRWNTDYIIIGYLDGPIIRDEGIWRPSIQIPLNWNGKEFIGGFATSGWRVKSAEHRTVEANLILRRVVSVATSRTPRASTPAIRK